MKTYKAAVAAAATADTADADAAAAAAAAADHLLRLDKTLGITIPTTFLQPTVIIYKYATYICKHIHTNIGNNICTNI